MKLKMLVAALLLAVAIPASAQTPRPGPQGLVAKVLDAAPTPIPQGTVPSGQPNGSPPSVTLNWNSSVTPGVGYNVYRAATAGGEGGTAALNGATPVSGTTFVDTTVTTGTSFFYVVSATLAGVQSKFSNEVSAVIPNLPSPPVLSGATIVASFNGNHTTKLSASYTDTSGLPTAYQLWGGTQLLQQGQPKVAANGQYAVTWTGKNALVPNPSITIEDAAGNQLFATTGGVTQ